MLSIQGLLLLAKSKPSIPRRELSLNFLLVTQAFGDTCISKTVVLEFFISEKRKESADKTLEAYKIASDIAVTELPPTHPVHPGLTLNFFVFDYKIRNSADHLTKQAFDDAFAELDTLSEESYKDPTLIMQLFRDNLTLWASDMQDSGK
ncbi:hypothetical protein EIP86_001540 [Pleurotus ostreatoroseus]|nr:hypothetical protein EIP86_001540 [Pleurotus ostreatoroseus]